MNKDIDLCGLGNGLVDIQFEIPDKDLERLSLRKGEMRLTQGENPIEIMAAFNDKRPFKCSGGSGANSVIAFSALGGKAAYSTVLGNDELGRFYANEFEELNIELKSKFLDEMQTGTCFVFVTPDSERTMLTSLGATATFSEEHLDEDFIKRAKWLYIEGYKFSEQNSTEAIEIAIDLAKKYDTKIAVSFSDLFIIENHREKLEKVTAASDLIFCNEQEAVSFTGENNGEKAFNKLNSEHQNAVVTFGKEGSMIAFDNKIYKIPAYPVQAVDTTGAGDMFAGVFLWGLMYENDIKKAGHLASYASARVVSQLGARLKENLKEIRNKLFQDLENEII